MQQTFGRTSELTRNGYANFDTKSADSVFDLMRQVNRESGTSFLMVTHSLGLAKRCDSIIDVVDGRIAR